MLHPFKVGQRADRVLYLEKRNHLYRSARNEIVGWDGRLILLWHFESATLKIGWDPAWGAYGVREITHPMETGKRMNAKKAKLSAKEAEKQLARIRKLEATDG